MWLLYSSLFIFLRSYILPPFELRIMAVLLVCRHGGGVVAARECGGGSRLFKFTSPHSNLYRTGVTHLTLFSFLHPPSPPFTLRHLFSLLGFFPSCLHRLHFVLTHRISSLRVKSLHLTLTPLTAACRDKTTHEYTNCISAS